MIGIMGRVLTVAAFLVVGTSAAEAEAQRVVQTQASFGVVLATVGTAAGLYVDGSRAVLPMTRLIGEIQVLPSNHTELLALGGVRQTFFRSSQGELYAQLLFGIATGYSRRCDLCGARASEFGLGANVMLNDRWALRVRGDIRTGGAAGDLPIPMLGGGITRSWGSR